MRFVAYYYCNGWHFSLGLHVNLEPPYNIEIHLPCGFVRIGWVDEFQPKASLREHPYRFLYRHWGWD